VEDKPEQYKINLDNPVIVSEEYPLKEGTRTEEYTLPNYQINHTAPSGSGLFSNYTLLFGIKVWLLVLVLVIYLIWYQKIDSMKIILDNRDITFYLHYDSINFMCVGLQKMMK
jgi:hypothetical protein